jgi:hypothetical protein
MYVILSAPALDKGVDWIAAYMEYHSNRETIVEINGCHLGPQLESFMLSLLADIQSRLPKGAT